MGEPDAQLLEGEDGPPLVAGLGDQRDRGAFEIVPEPFEGVEVGVRPEEPHPRPAGRVAEPPLCLGAFRAGLRVAGGEGDGERDLRVGEFVDQRQRVGHEKDREVDGFGQIADAADTGEAEDGLAHRVHRA